MLVARYRAEVERLEAWLERRDVKHCTATATDSCDAWCDPKCGELRDYLAAAMKDLAKAERRALSGSGGKD